MTLREADRGISDVVGFVLAFSIILASGTIVATIGFDQIEEARDNEQVRTAQNGMVELAESYDYLLQRTDDQRRAGLALNGGTLELSPSELSVSVGGGPSTAIDVWALEHTVSDRRVVYEAGGVFAGEGGIVSYRPALSCRDGTAIVSLLQFDDDEFYLSRGTEDFDALQDSGRSMNDGVVAVSEIDAISDEGGVLMQVNYEGSEIIHRKSLDASTTVTVDVSNAAHPGGWKQFADRYDVGWSVSGDQLTCSASRILIRTTTASVRLSGN